MSQPIKSFRHKQWTIDVDPSDESYEIYNRGSNGEKQFYKIVPGKYGEPLIVAEPDLAFDPPARLAYVDKTGLPVTPDQKIAGLICEDGRRFSLTHAKLKGIAIKVSDDDRSIQVGEEKWWLVTLLLKDKNRVRNYDAYCIPFSESEMHEPLAVRVLELGDLDLFRR